MRFIETNEAKYLDIKKAPPKRGLGKAVLFGFLL